MYEQLSKIYYKDSARYLSEYEKRINSYGAIRLPIHIKPFKSKDEFACFYVNHNRLDFLHDQIIKQSKMINSIESQLPDIAVAGYVNAKLVDELMSTNEIEGVRSTKAEMETVIEIVVRKESSKKSKARHLSLMKSYFKLSSETQTVLENVDQIRTIYDQLVHEEIKREDELDGELFRSHPVDVVSSTQKVVHKGVHPEQSIKVHLANLIRYLNEHPSPMLYKIAVAHYYFGYIHPFYDGNGRTSRYISSMYLINELDKLTALTLSYSTNKAKQLYYDAFTECNHPLNKGELTTFCEAFFEIINKAQNDILADLTEKQIKMKRLNEVIENLPLSDDFSKNILFILGQNFIFGIEGKGMTRKELLRVTNKTDYVIKKHLDLLSNEEFIEYLGRKPIEVTISDKLSSDLI